MKIFDLLTEFAVDPTQRGGGGPRGNGIYIYVSEGHLAFVENANSSDQVTQAIVHAAQMQLAKLAKRGGGLAGWTEKRVATAVKQMMADWNHSDGAYEELTPEELEQLQQSGAKLQNVKLTQLAHSEATRILDAIQESIKYRSESKVNEPLDMRIANGKTKFSTKEMAQIKRDPEAANAYAVHVVKGPWPEGEPAIIEGPIAKSSWYFCRIKKERSPEVEQKMLSTIESFDEQTMKKTGSGKYEFDSSLYAAALYAKTFFKGKWPEMEDVVSHFGLDAQRYFLNKLKD